MKIKLFLAVTFFAMTLMAQTTDHGIYMLTNEGIKSELKDLEAKIIIGIDSTDFNLLYSDKISVPDYVREDKSEHCGFKAHLFVLSHPGFNEMLVSFETKYIVGGFLRIGLYETPGGVNVVITDPETVSRIVFNDLYENDKVDEYQKAVQNSITYKNELISFLHATVGGTQVQTPLEPIRDNEDLAESSKDMFMLVGPMTFFNDEDQFPEIYSVKKSEGYSGIQKLKEKLVQNIKIFQPLEDDKEYRWYQNKDDLKWKVVAEITSPKNDAVLLGITRPRTEAVSFNIAGSSREEDNNLCPGIDHVTAYPIEVLLIQEGEFLKVYTPREMFRMDMYFWDAGMAAFMDHMSMPGILDESIKKALLGKEYKE